MSRLRSSELSPIQKMGRRNKQRGYEIEKQLEKFLNQQGIPAKRVPASGRFKKVGVDRLRGDVQLEYSHKTLRVEVKSRKKLPRYITNLFINRTTHQTEKKPPEERVVKIHGLCAILDQDQFLKYIYTGDLPEIGVEIFGEECKSLRDWFEQDDCPIVAMKEFRGTEWFFAVKTEEI